VAAEVGLREDPWDPDSQLTENFLDEVIEATGRVATFIQGNCGP
jgi:hypothetical protein